MLKRMLSAVLVVAILSAVPTLSGCQKKNEITHESHTEKTTQQPSKMVVE